MEKKVVSQDDVTDVLEMTQRLEDCIGKVLHENEITLSISALISATINSMLAQCQTLDEVVLYRNIFVEIFDSTIREITVREQ
jgi:hypothetical protein